LVFGIYQKHKPILGQWYLLIV